MQKYLNSGNCLGKAPNSLKRKSNPPPSVFFKKKEEKRRGELVEGMESKWREEERRMRDNSLAEWSVCFLKRVMRWSLRYQRQQSAGIKALCLQRNCFSCNV